MICNLYALYGCKCCDHYFVDLPKRYRLHHFLGVVGRNRSQPGDSYADVSGIRAGTEHGWHLTEWLDRNEVSSRRAVLRSFIFAVFWRLDNRHILFARLRIKNGFFSGRTECTACPTIKKQQRHRRTARRNLLSFLSKPLCQMPPVFCACPNPGNCVLETIG